MTVLDEKLDELERVRADLEVARRFLADAMRALDRIEAEPDHLLKEPPCSC